MSTLQNRLTDKIEPFLDAGYPILYINSYEESKIDITLKDNSDANSEIAVGSTLTAGTELGADFKVGMKIADTNANLSMRFSTYGALYLL